MDKKSVYCQKCGASISGDLERCEFCGERNAASESAPAVKSPSEVFPAVTPSKDSNARAASSPLKRPEPDDFDFVRAAQRTMLIMLSGVFLFLCPIPVPAFYKSAAVLSALLGIWSRAFFRAFGLTAMVSAGWMCFVVYSQGISRRQLFTEKDYYSQGAKGPIPEWALFKKTLFQSLSGFEWVCLFAAAAGAAYILWAGFYAFKIRKARRAAEEK